jgi:hypothetical protein
MGREPIRCRKCRERFFVSRAVALKSGNPLIQRPNLIMSSRTKGRIVRRIILVAVFTLAFALFWFLLDKIVGEDGLSRSSPTLDAPSAILQS